MKILLIITLFVGLSCFAMVGHAAEEKGPPKVGDMAPDVELAGSDGKKYSLSKFRGKKGVVIAWYPKAFTGG